jgi:hypothetical protein
LYDVNDHAFAGEFMKMDPPPERMATSDARSVAVRDIMRVLIAISITSGFRVTISWIAWIKPSIISFI